jgi:hypothetical protein
VSEGGRPQERPRFRIGYVVGDTFAVWGRSLPVLIAMAAVFELPLFAAHYWLLQSLTDARARRSWEQLLTGGQNFLVPTLLEGLAALLVFQRLQGQRPEVGRSLQLGLRRVATVLGIAFTKVLFLVLLAAAIGFLAFTLRDRSGLRTTRTEMAIGFAALAVIPIWIALALAFFVPTPAALVEKRGVFSALNRSRRLTAGSRFRIFWLLILFWISTGTMTRLLSYFIEAIDEPLPQLIATTVLETLVATLSATFPIVLYYRLREAKEGIGIAELLRVFE